MIFLTTLRKNYKLIFFFISKVLSNKIKIIRPMLETLYYTIRIGSTPTFLYFDLYIYIYSSLVLTGKHIHFKVAPYGFLKIEKKNYVGLKNCLWIFRKRIQLKLCIE